MGAESAAAQPLSLLDVANAYVADRAGVLAPSTLTTYWRIIRTALAPLHMVPVQSVTSDRVQAFISDFALSHSPKTTSSVIGLISSVVSAVVPNRRLRVRLPQKVPHELDIPDAEQVRLLLESASPDFRPVIVLASCMGLRRAEISALTCSDVCGQSLRIRHTLSKGPDRKWVKKAAETSSGVRNIHIPLAAAPYLQRPSDVGDDTPIVPLSPDAITRRFERLCASLGLSYHFHALRHYYASVLLALHVPDKYAMSIIGHSTHNMLKQVYQHIMADGKNEID